MSDSDHPEFDNDSIWPRRLLHVPTMTSHKWQPGNRYNGQREPRYNAFSYTWGRWRLNDDILEKPNVDALPIKGVPWNVPRIDPAHFTVEQFDAAIRRATEQFPTERLSADTERSRRLLKIFPNPPHFLWLDVACIDQRETAEGKAEVGRQARIFRIAHEVYVWLSRTSYSDITYLRQSLRSYIAPSDGWGYPRTVSQTQEWRLRCQEVHNVVRQFVKDPWFSSLWTLQEAFLCSTGLFLSLDGSCVGFSSGILMAELAEICNISRTALRLQSTTGGDKSDLQQTENLLDLIESIGAEGLSSGNPMAVLTAVRFRKASKDVDTVYGIMQVFGDACRVGEAAPETRHLDHQYTLCDLQDELGHILLCQYPMLSQMHIHLDPPPVGKGWRVCGRSAEALATLGLHAGVHRRPARGDPSYRPEDFGHGDPRYPYDIGGMVSTCRLGTATLDGVTWGKFTGRACAFDHLQQEWSRNYKLDTSTSGPLLKFLGFALDSLPILQGTESPLYAFGERITPFPECDTETQVSEPPASSNLEEMACFFECDEEATFPVNNQEMPTSTWGAEASQGRDAKITSPVWKSSSAREQGEQMEAANSRYDEDPTSSHYGEEIPFSEFVEKNGFVALEDMETGSGSGSSEPSDEPTDPRYWAMKEMTLCKSSTFREEEEKSPSPEIEFESESDGQMAPEQDPEPEPEHLAFEMQLAREIAERFRGRRLVVLLLGDRREDYIEGGYWRVTNELLLQNGEDMFLGLILLRQTHEDGRGYWQRLGTGERIEQTPLADLQQLS
ncbi:hypothetical protein BJY01DRAFT_251947 [Aspergillus pseudoustus]|uniref:Heterokaryon incompatibility domain-containing protein n=1 Tax=Aspergillus pseudoustus TaxID=1810923 RepID=A0ABR4J9P0_9EURO